MTAALAFTKADIERVAGPRSFERGFDYLESVEDLEVSSAEVTATVYGSYRYRVTLAVGDGLTGECSCPHGQEGYFCKHCVAVGLAVLALGDDLPRHVEAKQAQEAGLRSWLESLSKEELLTELLRVIDGDRDLRRSFELRVAAAHTDAAVIRRAVLELIQITHYIEYDEIWDYALKVSEAADAIGSLVDADGAADAIAIAREAIALVTEEYESVADSGGTVRDSAQELLDVHLRACQAAPPDPISLADYLVELLLNGDYGFEPDIGDYADLLGDRGSSRMRDRIAAASASGNIRARHLMESILKAEGDVDALIDIYSADLDEHGRSHLRIAGELDQAGRSGEALGWAERGLREAASPDQRLIDYLADRYAADGRTDDVLALRRARFLAERTLHNYRALRQAATARGSWAAERASALDRLSEDARDMFARAYPGAYPGWGPVLVDALIDDGDVDAAWTAVTSGLAKNNATEGQRLRLADASVLVRPADALAVYLGAIEPLRRQAGDRVYRELARLLLSARSCHERLGSADEFSRYLVAFRVDQKRKRNLMRILDENGL